MFGLQRNVDFKPPLKLSSWRKIAIGTWSTVGDPSVYGILELETEAAEAYIKELKEKTGKHITLSHFVGRAMGETLRRHPEINSTLRWGRIYPRKTVDIFFQVASDSSGNDLSGKTIRSCEDKTVVDICDELNSAVKKIRANDDVSFKAVKQIMKNMPSWLSKLVLNFTGLLMYGFNRWAPWTGSPRDPMGSLMITNVGSIGMDTAFAPLVPYSRVPLLITLGRAEPHPVVKDGKVVVARTIKLNATFDHRLIDGMHCSNMAKTLKKIFADPRGELRESIDTPGLTTPPSSEQVPEKTQEA